MEKFDPASLGRALDHLPLATWIWVPDERGVLRLTGFNRAAMALSGEDLRGAIGEAATEWLPAGSPVARDLQDCLAGAGPRERELGEYPPLIPAPGRHRLVCATPLPGMVLLHAQPLADPAARDPADPASFLRRLLANLPGMAYRCRNDPDWTMEFVSPGSEALTGLPARALLENRERTFASLVHPDDRDMVWQVVQEGLRGRGRFDVAYRIVRPDGAVRWVWEQGTGVEGGDAGDGVETIEGFITDITDRHELALELREKEQQYHILVEQDLAGVYLIEKGRLVYVNGRTAEIFGRTVEDLLALGSVLEVVHPDDREEVRENLRLREAGEAQRIEYGFRALRAPDDEVIHIEAHGSVVERGGRKMILGVLQDVSHRVRAAERYHHTQKMEALGRLAGGIAHDFNNVLSVIRTLAELLSLELEGRTALTEDLEEMKRAAERGASLSRQLMTFSRPRPDHVERLSLSAAVEDLIPMLERILGADVRLVRDLDPELPEVEVDPSHVEQILMNLVINARDAMPQGGHITLRTGRGQGPAGADSALGVHVWVEVSDTGIGIPETLRRRIFEPFFTTKGTQGTGLGLGNVWSIVDGYGGSVDVSSEVGRGSSFTVRLPMA
jgi:two-component system, cell cycle sensor histidine kinase and response regulator CckA